MSIIRFVWDPKKNTASQRKHGVSFEEAQTVFYDEYAQLIADPDHSDEEDRFIRLRRIPRPWPWRNALMRDIPFQRSIYHASADFAHRRMTHRSLGVGGYGFGGPRACPWGSIVIMKKTKKFVLSPQERQPSTNKFFIRGDICENNMTSQKQNLIRT
jgi:hypothetical protein